MNALLMSLLLISAVSNAQVASNESGNLVPNDRSFDVAMYMESPWTVNLMLTFHQPKRIIVTLKDTQHTVLYQEHLKKASTIYRRKFKFDESESGVYLLEISDGNQTIVRRVEVVDIPAVKSQRYITYGPQ